MLFNKEECALYYIILSIQLHYIQESPKIINSKGDQEGNFLLGDFKPKPVTMSLVSSLENHPVKSKANCG